MMYVRKLTREEAEKASLISVIAFHIRVVSLDKGKEEVENGFRANDWGCFDDNGTMLAHIIDSSFTSRFDGHEIKNSAIGAVSTLPEYRNMGAVREIMKVMLPQSRKDGRVISTLYPFKHSFYNKFGYELCCMPTTYEFKPSLLSKFRFNGWAKMWRPGDSIDEYTKVYNTFAERYNLSCARGSDIMAKEISGDCYKDGKFHYLLGVGDTSQAYITFVDEKSKDDNKLSVKELAYTGKDGLLAILGFLARYEADYGDIELPLPSDINFKSLTDPYESEKITKCDYMARILDVQKVLSMMKKPSDAKFTIAVTDELIPENNGTWLVEGDSAVLTEDKADIKVSINALAPMTIGFVNLYMASFRKDVEIISNYDTLEKVFIEKPILNTEHF